MQTMFYNLFTGMPFMVCLFWTVVLGLEWRTANPAKHVLTLFMAVGTLLYFCHMVFFTQSDGTGMAVANSLYSFCNIAVFPLYYLYIRRLTRKRHFVRQWLVLLPAFAIFTWTSLNYLVPFGTASRNACALTAKAIFLAQLLPVCWFGWKDLSNFDALITNLYADTESRTVKRTRTMMVVLFGGAVISGLSGQIGRAFFAENPALLAFPSTFFSVLLFAVGYVGVKQNFFIDDLGEPAEVPASELEEAKTLTIHEQTVERLMERLNLLMNDRKLYLQQDLRLADVVQQMGVSRTVVSNLINQRMGMSFSDYVNALRVEHAKGMIRQVGSTDKTILLEVLEKSGFTSETSFYRAFRKHTGLTPRDWMRNSGVL